MSRAAHRLPLLTLVVAVVTLLAGAARAQTPTPTPGGDCCAAHDSRSCDDVICRDCVCTIDPFCCSVEWDDSCVERAEIDCPTDCPCAQPTPTPGGDCCSVHAGTGCDIGACQACVCAEDGACCNLTWDATCVSIAGIECSASCPCVPPPTETPAPTPTPGGDCCTAHAGAQCDDATCEACVCALDAACCNNVWDGACAEQAAIECALACACPAPGDCCAAHEGVSCNDVRCKTCVCDLDAACCTDQWDTTCAEEAAVDCAVDCACDPAGDCCTAHDGVGCEETGCQDCVCALDEACCTDVWDARCAEEAAVECASRCSECALSDCCEAREAPGCNDDPCEACVCNVDDFCCDELWDAGCVSIAENDCPDECVCGSVPVCPGDCNDDGEVSINELILSVNIALGNQPLSQCPAIDTSGDGEVGINELIQAVNAALNGCPT